MASSWNLDKLGSANQAGQSSGLARRSSHILAADHDQRRHTQGVKSIPDTASGEHAVNRTQDSDLVILKQSTPVALPLLGPVRVVEKSLAEEDRHDPANDRTQAEPTGEAPQKSVAREIRLGFRIGRCVEQHKALHKVRARQGNPHGDETAHRQTHQVDRSQIQVLEQGYGIVGKRIHVIARLRHFATALSTMVPGDASVSWRKRLDLRCEEA